MPIHQLLSRIRWDPEFGQGDFTVGYQDRFSPEVVYVPLKQLQESPTGGQALVLQATDGEEITIPLHRIVEVRKDGQPIWQRVRSRP
jgi:uncharacterized protein (UPF0248 family)